MLAPRYVAMFVLLPQSGAYIPEQIKVNELSGNFVSDQGKVFGQLSWHLVNAMTPCILNFHNILSNEAILLAVKLQTC